MSAPAIRQKVKKFFGRIRYSAIPIPSQNRHSPIRRFMAALPAFFLLSYDAVSWSMNPECPAGQYDSPISMIRCTCHMSSIYRPPESADISLNGPDGFFDSVFLPYLTGNFFCPRIIPSADKIGHGRFDLLLCAKFLPDI